jgi:transcriptional regulator with XRE-family HTH domain
MSYGYSVRLIQLNNEADNTLIGVRLGRVCIEHDIPVLDVARELRVSRQTIYHWFCGTFLPKKEMVARIRKYMDALA